MAKKTTTTTSKTNGSTKNGSTTMTKEAATKLRDKRVAAVAKLHKEGLGLRKIEHEIGDLLGLAKDDPRRGKGWTAFRFLRMSKKPNPKAAAKNVGWMAFRKQITQAGADTKPAAKKTAKKPATKKAPKAAKAPTAA